MYGEGISKEGDLIDLAVINNIVEKSGSWFSYKGERVGQGRENAKAFLKENKDILAKIEAEVRKALGLIKDQPALVEKTAEKTQAAAAPSGAASRPVAMPAARR
jgi:recombination protein RecA